MRRFARHLINVGTKSSESTGVYDTIYIRLESHWLHWQARMLWHRNCSIKDHMRHHKKTALIKGGPMKNKRCRMNAWVWIALLAGGSLFAEDAPNPNQVRVNGIAYAGSGCPAGSVANLLAPDAKAFTLLFDSYVAEAGPGILLSAGRKNCQIAVDLRFPQGFSYSLFKVDYRGYAHIDRGATGIQQTRYYFQGSSSNAVMRSTYVGPRDENYQISDTLGISAVVWSPCGSSRALNMNTEVRVSASNGSRALMTVDSIDGELKHIYGIRWRRCQ